MRTSRRFELRARTADAHRRLDETVGAWETLAEYRKYLRSLYRFRSGVEDALQQRVPTLSLGSWRWAAVAELMRADLLDVGHLPDELHAFTLPASTSGVLGTLYVVEGASLGAQILERRATALGLSATFGARHLTALSKRNVEWRRFLDLLESAEPFDIETASSGALAAFAAAQEAFQSMSMTR